MLPVLPDLKRRVSDTNKDILIRAILNHPCTFLCYYMHKLCLKLT